MTNIVTITANNYCHSVFDGTHATPKPCPNGYKLITSKNITGDGINIGDAYFISEQDYFEINKRSKVYQWDILFSMIGTVGNLYLEENSDIDYAIKNIGVFSCRDEFKAKWLFYYLQSPMAKNHIKRFLNGAVQKFLSLKQLRDFPILPFEKDKISIVEILSSLDKKIALNKQINARLEQMAKTLYDYWFVQFDFPDANGKPYKSSGGEMAFDETLKRKIPKGWEVKSLGKHITIKRGISYKSNEIKDTGVPFINLNSFYLDGKFKFEGTKFFTGKTKNDDFISSGDLLIAVTDVTRNADIIGKAFILPDLFNNSPVMSCDVAKISSSELNNFYLERLFNSSSYHEYIKYFASGTLVLHLDIKGISWFDTYIPPRILLDKFEDFCRNIHLRMVETEKQNHQLTQLRDFLLPMLMNGQVSVVE